MEVVDASWTTHTDEHLMHRIGWLRVLSVVRFRDI